MGSPHFMPPGYVAEAELVVQLVKGWLEVKQCNPPRFRLPPRDILIAAGVDQLPAMAVNDSARGLLKLLIESGRNTFGEPPTVLQLRVALDMNGVRPELCSLDDLGLGRYTLQVRDVPACTRCGRVGHLAENCSQS